MTLVQNVGAKAETPSVELAAVSAPEAVAAAVVSEILADPQSAARPLPADANGVATARVIRASLDLLGRAAILIDRSGIVRDVTPAALALLGAELGLIEGRLVAADPATAARLDAAIAGAAAGNTVSGETVAVGRAGRRPLVLRILSWAPAETGGVAAVVLVTDLDERPMVGEERLRAAFRLSPGEARLAALIGSGLSPRVAAGHLHVTEETARTLLKRVFAKTGVSRQSELAVLLTRLSLK